MPNFIDSDSSKEECGTNCDELLNELKEDEEAELEDCAPEELTETLAAMLPQVPLSEEMIEYVCNPFIEDSEYFQEAIISNFVNRLKTTPSNIANKYQTYRVSKRINKLLTNIALTEKRLQMARERKMYHKAVPKLENNLKNYNIALKNLEKDMTALERRAVEISKKRIQQSVSNDEAIKSMTESVVVEGYYNNRGLPQGKNPSKLKVIGAPLLLPKNERAAARTEMYFKQLGKGVNSAAKKAVFLAMRDVRADKRLSAKSKFKPVYCTMTKFKDGIDIDLYGDIDNEVSAKITVHLKDGQYEEYSVMATTRNKETTEISKTEVRIESPIRYIDSDNEEFMENLAFMEAMEANSTKIGGFKGSININMQKAQPVTNIKPAPDNENIKTWIGNVKDWVRKTIDWFKGDQNKSPVVKSSFQQVENQVGKLEQFIKSPEFLNSGKRDQAFTRPFQGTRVAYASTDDLELGDEFYESEVFLEALATSSTMINGYKNSITTNMKNVENLSKGEIKTAPDNSNIKIFISNVKFWIKKAAQWFKGKAITTNSFDAVKQQVGKLDNLVADTAASTMQNGKAQARTVPFQGTRVAYASTDDITDDDVTTEAANMEQEIEPIVRRLNSLGYEVKYASPGHTKLRKKEDKSKDGVYYSKLYSDAKIMFKGDYKFPDAPKGWKWRTVDKKDYLDIIPKPYDEKDGSPVVAFNKWKKEYMDSLRNWANSLPHAGSSPVTKANDNTSENKKRKSEEPNIIKHENVNEEVELPEEDALTMEDVFNDMYFSFVNDEE